MIQESDNVWGKKHKASLEANKANKYKKEL